MNFRVTPLGSLSQAIRAAQLHSSQLANLNLQASSGIRIHRPSDDPQAVRNLLSKKLQESRIGVHLDNVDSARTTLNQSVSTLLEVNSLLVRARDAALEGNQSQEPETLADEVDRLLQRLIDLANTHDGERYLFAGTSVNTKPFEASQAGGQVDAVEYFGAAEASSVVVAAEVSVETTLSGAEVFQPFDGDHTGTTDAFQALIELRDDLRNTSGLPPAEWHDAIGQRIADLDWLHNHVLNVVGQQSLTLEDLDVIQRRLEDTQLATREAVSNLESADIAEVALKLQAGQNLLQFTFATTAGLFDQSLLDFLR